MPVLPPGGGSQPGTCIGLTRSDVIELANQLTERRGEKVLSLDLLFFHVLQDFCGRNRYWWRNYYAVFDTVANQQSYDFDDSAVFTPDLSEIGVEEITQVSLAQPTSNPPIVYLDPVFDQRTQIEMQQGFNQTGTAASVQPARYTIVPNRFNSLLLDKPNGVYSMAITFWAMPNPKKDSVSDCIPLVPPWHQKALVAGMEAKIWKRVEGIGSKQYISANAEYENAIILAQARKTFTTNYSQQLVSTEDAVRSTQ